MPAALAVALVLAGTAGAGDRGVLAALHRYLPPAQAATELQARYDAGRDLEEALRAAEPVSDACRRVLRAGLSFARGEVVEAEGTDLRSPTLRDRGRARSAAAARALRGSGASCRTAAVPPAAAVHALDVPLAGSVVAGPLLVRVRVPAGTTRAVLRMNGRTVSTRTVAGRSTAWTLHAAPGRYSVVVRLLRRSRVVRVAAANGVWVVSASARHAAAPVATDQRLSARLARLGRSFPGYSALWVHDLVSGRTAGWNADARFPAASTVKLGVLAAALRRFGPRPERSRVAYDLQTLTGWSSNLASNRLLLELGGSQSEGARLAEDALHRMGATASTFTGFYRVGTARSSTQPPLVSRRVTTARDLGRILYVLHAAALGRPGALRAAGLSEHEAQVGLNLLLSSRPGGDNIGLLRPSLGAHYVLAQKNGWIRAARHTAAILYAARGPLIVVVLTYRGSGVTRAEATAFAGRVLQIVGR